MKCSQHLNWVNYSKIFNLTRIGLLLVVVAGSIWLCSVIELKSNEIMLTQNLGIEEVWLYEGALQWWRNFYTTAIIPATAVLALSGIALLLLQHLPSRFVQKAVLNRLEERVKKVIE
ncbi:MAG: hypothetical protein PVH73_06525 [Candidatus Bathyarchaeota archaeon]|jgi:hypothetical protein